jgi:hypothetical protein
VRSLREHESAERIHHSRRCVHDLQIPSAAAWRQLDRGAFR